MGGARGVQGNNLGDNLDLKFSLTFKFQGTIFIHLNAFTIFSDQCSSHADTRGVHPAAKQTHALRA